MRAVFAFLLLWVHFQVATAAADEPSVEVSAPPACGSLLGFAAGGLRSIALVKIPVPVMSAFKITLGGLFYPALGAARAVRGAYSVIRGETRFAEIPKKIAATLKKDLPVMAAYGALLLFAQSSTMSVSELESGTRPFIESKLSQNVYVLNAFSDEFGLRQLTENRIHSAQEGFPNATHLVRDDILPKNFDGGTSKISAWGRIILTLMRRVKESGKRIDLLDLHFHGYRGEMVLFNNEHLVGGLEFADTGLSINADPENGMWERTGLALTMRDENLCADIFNPGAVIRLHGCSFGGGNKGMAAVTALGRAHLGRNGGSVCFTKVAVMRDYPETLQTAIGVEPAYAGVVNPISRYSLAPVSVLRLLMLSVEEKKLPPFDWPTGRVHVLNIEPGTMPVWSNASEPFQMYPTN